jgi:hypothetical protein
LEFQKAIQSPICLPRVLGDDDKRYHQFKPYFVQTAEGELEARGYPLPRPEDGNLGNSWAGNLAVIHFIVELYGTIRNREIIVPDPTEQLFDKIRRTVEARGARLVVGLQRHEPQLEAHLQAQNIPYTTFDGALAYPTAGWHWTPEGNAQVARQYLAFFDKIGISQSLTPRLNDSVPLARSGADDDRLNAARTTVLSPSIWLGAAGALPSELVGFGRLLKSWAIAVMDAGTLPRIAATLLALTILYMATFVLLFWWRHRVSLATDTLDRFSRARSSFGVFLGLALATPLSTILLLESAETRMFEVSYGFVVGVIVAAFGRAVGLGLFASDAPQRRLVAVNDAIARSLSAQLAWVARVLGAWVVALAVHKALAAPMALRVATDMLFALVVGAMFLHLLLAQRRGDSDKGLTHSRLLHALGWLIPSTIALTLAAGYPAIATFVAAGSVSVAMVTGALYLVLALGHAIWAERPLYTARGEAIAANFGVNPRWLGLAIALTYVGLCLAVALAALFLYVVPW